MSEVERVDTSREVETVDPSPPESEAVKARAASPPTQQSAPFRVTLSDLLYGNAELRESRRSISLWFSYNLWPELACIQRSSSQIKLEKLRVPLSANLSWFEESSQLRFRKESITVILMLRRRFKIWIRCSRPFCSIQEYRETAGTLWFSIAR